MLDKTRGRYPGRDESRIKIRAFPGAMGGGKGIMGYIIIGITVSALYLAPSFVAYKRRHHSMTGIFFMNFLLGWTFVGWAGALVWAFTKVEPPSEAPEEG